MAVSRQTWASKDNRPWWARVKDANERRADAIGVRHGYRSGLEEKNAKHLAALGVPPLFETLKIKYEVPRSLHTYTPDFPLRNGIIIETKGKFENSDRAKHLFIKTQYPELDIRFVFQRPSDPIYKGSKTTLAQWAEKFGFKWAAQLIPADWLKEKGPKRKPEVVLAEGEAKMAKAMEKTQ